jgi:hypothetical protein
MKNKMIFSSCQHCNGECLKDPKCNRVLTLSNPKYATICAYCGAAEWKSQLKDEIKEIYQANEYFFGNRILYTNPD